MFQVYISSTYHDLRDFRATAAKAVRHLQCRAIAMEDYLASDERPLDRCLADVRASNVYVGLFARRYGFTPSGQNKSITQLEYEEAGLAGIPRLIFILDESVNWAESNSDSNPASILQLRTALQEKHLVSTFRNLDELDARLTAALSLELQKQGGNGKVEIPELLPYMNNRSRQRDQLADALDMHFEQHPRRPFITLVYGDEREAHSAFVERLQRVTLPDLLGLGADSEPLQHFDLRWSEPGSALDVRERRLQSRLAESLTGDRRADTLAMAQELSRYHCPVMISSSILSTDWQSDEENLVQRLLKYWAAWPDLPPGQKLFIVLSFHLKDGSQASFWARRKLNRKNKCVCEFISQLKNNVAENFSLVALEKLEAISEADVQNWLEDHARKFCRESQGVIRDPLVLEEQLKPWLREFFRKEYEMNNSNGIHMEKLARELRHQLDRCLNKGEI